MASAKTTTETESKRIALKNSSPAEHTRARRLHGHIKRRYDTYMPNQKHHRVLVWVIFVIVASVIAAQLLYPLDRALPFARIQSDMVGFTDEVTLAKRINDDFLSSKLEFSIPNAKAQQYKLTSAGAEPKTDAMISELSDYPFWTRLIPFSILLHAPHITELQVEYSRPVLSEFSRRASAQLGRLPVNAGLAIKDSKVVSTDDQPGSVVAQSELARRIVDAPLLLGEPTKITPIYRSQPAEATSADFAEVKAQAELALRRPLTFMNGETTIQPDTKMRATWFELRQADAPDRRVTLEIDEAGIKQYYDTLDKSVGRPAGQTNVRLIDGQATDTDEGAVGRAIDQPALNQTIAAWLLRGEGQPTIVIPLKDVAPRVIYDNKYTSTENGLQAYVTDTARTQNANIVIQQIDGDKWSASDSATLSIPSASTYKLFLALDLFDRMNKGQTNWNDPILDTDVNTCFNRMTIASTNPCSVEWINQWGRQSIDNFIYGKGFSHGTDFNGPGATKTTAADLNKFMIGLENGRLIGGAQRDRLLHSLSVHPYRYGIPTGSQGRVYDKVGFLWDYVHDTAIVYHPKGKYVMTIMTKGRSYGTIAQITREAERIMYP